MAIWLQRHDAVPQIILASTAKRVAETVERMLHHWQSEPLVLRYSTLYLASPQTILEHVRCEAVDAQGLRPQRLLVIGHNPGMEQLVSSLAGVATSMPTAAVAVFQCQPIQAQDAHGPLVEQLLAIGRPKDLA